MGLHPIVGANEWHDFPQSSNVRAAFYAPDSRRLYLMLGPIGQAPRKYLYEDVPPETFEGLLSAPSKGKYHHANIKSSFRFVRADGSTGP